MYLPDDEFLIRNRAYFTDIIILQAKLLYIYIYKLFIYLYINL
jgi:hypothetical protein